MSALTVEHIVFILMMLEAAAYAFVLVNAVRRRAGQEMIAALLTVFAFVALALHFTEAAWRAGWLPSVTVRGIQSVQVFGAFFLALLLIMIVRAFVRLESWSWMVFGVVWAAGLLMVDTNLLALPDILWSNGQMMLPRDGLSLGWAILGWVIFMIGVIANILGALRQQRQPMHRNRLSYFLPITFLVVANDLFILGGLPVPGQPLRLAATLLMGYVSLTHNLPDARLIMRRALIYFVTALLLVGVYLAIALGIQPLFQSLSNYNPVTSGAATVIVLAILATPLLGLVQRFVDRMLRIDRTNAGRTLHQYSEAISNILDMQKLASVAVGLIIESMQLQRGFLFLVDNETGEDGARLFRLRPARVGDDTESLSITLGEHAPVVSHFLLEMKPLLQYDLDLLSSFRGLTSSERQWFARLDADVYAPIFTNRRWIGMLALGQKLSGNRFTEDDLVTVSALANQTAVALENARLVENLMKLNSENRRAYRDLDKANRDLARLDQTKTDFISIASHELRTPLTVMRGYTEMLIEDDALDENLKHIVKSLHKSTLRLHEIMDSLFDIAQIDARALQIHWQKVDAAALISEVGHSLQKSVAARRQNLIVDMPALPTVKADPSILKKAFAHLLNNAIKFTPDNGSIAVMGKAVPPYGQELPNGGLVLTVSDTGVGVDPEFKELIFTKFYQNSDLGKHSTSKLRFQGGGVGLGLALTRGIVEAHGGRVWVESPGHDEKNFPGSKFNILLPLPKVEPSDTFPVGRPVQFTIGSENGSGGN
ncbi:MAG: Adaptive-response sensory-kinase SasA [Anaerolineales bacterium]|nr:Adaptive-response sensory-kinase SasA [Anaerolineales bacterium]